MTDTYELSHGSHTDPKNGRCAMEWVAYLAGEPHTDSPKCVSEFLGQTFILLNDLWEYDARQTLRPYLARCIGTADDGLDPLRITMCREWGQREALPWLLEQADLPELATTAREGAAPHQIALEVERAVGFRVRPTGDGSTRLAINTVTHIAGTGGSRYSGSLHHAMSLLGQDLKGKNVFEGVRKLTLALLDSMLPGERIEMPVARELSAA